MTALSSEALDAILLPVIMCYRSILEIVNENRYYFIKPIQVLIRIKTLRLSRQLEVKMERFCCAEFAEVISTKIQSSILHSCRGFLLFEKSKTCEIPIDI